ncbi:hypothetical protein HYW41_02025 [Candidatus Daviesbacteria bacterium]|nr:hypothetical protein [Candidatus Daviesbacteria bacterium]
MIKIIVLILIIPSIIIGLWFKDGYILGTAEDGLPFYNLSHFKPEADFAWMEHPGLGRSTLYLTASKPTYMIMTWLQNKGLPGFIIQAGVLWLMFVISGIGIYFLTQEFFPKLPKTYLILSILFYWFNPISLVNVWNRFLLDYISFYSMLPMVSFLFINGLKTKKYIWSIVFTIVILFYSYSFNYLAFFILIWLILFIWTVFFFLLTKNGSIRFFYIKYFLLAFAFFVLTNAWWVSQLVGFQTLKDFDSSIHDITTDINSGIFNALSKSMGNLNDVYRLNNASFFKNDSLSWVKPFYSVPIVFAEFIVTAIMFWSILKNKKDISVLILAGVFFTGIFLAKGNNPPLGGIFEFLFKNFLFLQIFRNPFEKSGFILLLAATPLLSFAIFKVSETLKPLYRKLIYTVCLIYIVLVWGYPFYTGFVLTSKFPPTNNYEIGYKVKVPEYYHLADDWLVKRGTNFRTIGFPIEDEAVTYKWEKGYSGVELSTALFSNPVILHKTGVPFFYDLVPQIQKTLLGEEEIYKLANILNARYLFVREDIDFKERKMVDPLIIKQKLSSRERMGQIRKVGEFGKLTFWENLKWKDLTFYPANLIKLSTSQDPSNLSSIDALSGEVLADKKYEFGDVNDSLDNLKITYERINPTKYIVHIQEAASPFVLVFSELFNGGWKITSEEGGKSYDHFRVNYYANGWLIDKKGNYDLTVEFSLQKWLDIGEKISIISFLVVLCLLIYLLWKNKQRKT